MTRTLGVHRATISRELRQGRWRHSNTSAAYTPYRLTALKTGAVPRTQYRAGHADRRAALRSTASHQRHRMHSDALTGWVIDQLRRGWTPEEICGKLPLAFAQDPRMRLCPETLYAWIYSPEQRHRGLGQYLPRARKRRRRRRRRGGRRTPRLQAERQRIRWGFPGPSSWLGPELGPLNRTHDVDEAWRALGGTGVDGAVLAQADDTAADTAAMLQAAHENPWVLGVVGWIPLDDPAGARSSLEELTADPKFKGIRHLVHDDPRQDFLELATVRESLEAVAAAGLAFDVPDAFPGHLGQTVQLARDIDSLTVVLDHLGKPPVLEDAAMEDWRVRFRALAELSQTVAKVSGLFTPGAPYTAAALRPVWEEALEAFGPGRLMFGGDWPISRLGGSYADIAGVLFELVSELSPTEQQAVLRGTATRVYRLDPAT